MRRLGTLVGPQIGCLRGAPELLMARSLSLSEFCNRLPQVEPQDGVASLKESSKLIAQWFGVSEQQVRRVEQGADRPCRFKLVPPTSRGGSPTATCPELPCSSRSGRLRRRSPAAGDGDAARPPALLRIELRSPTPPSARASSPAPKASPNTSCSNCSFRLCGPAWCARARDLAGYAVDPTATCSTQSRPCVTRRQPRCRGGWRR
jgi:hypothetical protein